MNEMMVACGLWVGTHLGLSSTPARQWLVSRVGERAYLAVYSLLAAGALGYLIWTYSVVPRFDYLWMPDPALFWVAKVTMPIAFILLIGGFLVRNPSAVGVSIDDPDRAADMALGVTRVTRHPFQWSVIIWGAGHVVANGDTVSVFFFGSFVVLSGLGSVLLDVKKARGPGEGWQRYAAVTSNVPFAAIIAGRNRLVVGELVPAVVLGLAAYGLIYYFHEALTGAVII